MNDFLSGVSQKLSITLLSAHFESSHVQGRPALPGANLGNNTYLARIAVACMYPAHNPLRSVRSGQQCEPIGSYIVKETSSRTWKTDDKCDVSLPLFRLLPPVISVVVLLKQNSHKTRWETALLLREFCIFLSKAQSSYCSEKLICITSPVRYSSLCRRGGNLSGKLKNIQEITVPYVEESGGRFLWNLQPSLALHLIIALPH